MASVEREDDAPSIEETIPTPPVDIETIEIISEMDRLPTTESTYPSVIEWIHSGGTSNVRDGSAMMIVGRLSRIPIPRRDKVISAVLEWIETKTGDAEKKD